MTKNFICYPMVIEKHSEKELYNAYFPDIEGCYTGGKSIQDTIEKGKEALGLHYLELETDEREIKEPSDPKEIKLKDNQKLIYIEVNMKWFREKDKYKSITKAVTLPKYLNQKAIESGVNVSAVLQKALMETLDIKDEED